MNTTKHEAHRLAGDRNQCPSCGEFFNSTLAFDKHRTGDYPARHCLSPDAMVAKGMAVSSAGFWVSKPRPEMLCQT